MKTIIAAMDEAVAAAHIELLTTQRDALLTRALAMQSFIRTVPGLLINARMDAKDGRHTGFDYGEHAKLTRTL